MQQQKQNVQDKHNQEAVINNRRFAKLKQLREEGDFFGEEAIKLRHVHFQVMLAVPLRTARGPVQKITPRSIHSTSALQRNLMLTFNESRVQKTPPWQIARPLIYGHLIIAHPAR